MGRRKNQRILDWIDTGDARQVAWATEYLQNKRRMDPTVGLQLRLHCGGMVAPDLVAMVTALQKGHHLAQDQAMTPGSGNEKAEADSMVKHLWKLDARMRRAWGERVRRAESPTKAFQLRMEPSVRPKLAMLRRRRRAPMSEIVQSLIEDAHAAAVQDEKDEREARKRRRWIKRVPIYVLELENRARRGEARQARLEGLVRQLAEERCILERRLEIAGLDSGVELSGSPAEQPEIKEKASRLAEVLLLQVEAEVMKVPASKELSERGKTELARFKMANPAPEN